MCFDKYAKSAVLGVLCLLILCSAAACSIIWPAEVSFAGAFGGVEPVKRTVNGLNIMVDPRMELLAAVQSLSGYNNRTRLLTSEQFSYKNDMAGYFKSYKSHAAVKYFDLLSMFGFTYDAPPRTVMYLTARYDETGDFGFDEHLIKRTDEGNLDRFLRHLLQFAADTDFNRFYNEHREFYEAVVERVSAELEGSGLVRNIEDYYGMKQNSYNIILVPMFHAGGYGPGIENENGGLDIYSIQGPFDVEGDIPVFGTAESFKDLVYHEFSHSFVNPVTAKHIDEVNKYSKLYDPIADIMKSNAYPNWEICVNEHIVRAVTARLLLIHEGFS